MLWLVTLIGADIVPLSFADQRIERIFEIARLFSVFGRRQTERLFVLFKQSDHFVADLGVVLLHDSPFAVKYLFQLSHSDE